MNIIALYKKGQRALEGTHDTLEETKVGTLRAGNTGAIALDGKTIGKCHRMTYLRYKGIVVDVPEENRELMFAGGRSNEDDWVEKIKAGGFEGTVLREEEIPISWMTSSGVAVTGRPDIVLCELAPIPSPNTKIITDNINDSPFNIIKYVGEPPVLGPKPVYGIELKQVSSIWTARDVGFQYKPKTQHLLQAAHYSWKLGIPFSLVYTSRTDFAVGSGWEQKTFPNPKKLEEMGLLDRVDLSYSEVWYDEGKRKYKGVTKEQYDALPDNRKDIKIKKVFPFLEEYELGFTDKGQLRYRRAGTEEWQYTIITTEGIREYYEKVAAMDTTKDLGSRPAQIEASGEKAGFSQCNYCPMQSICDDTDAEATAGKGIDFDKWKDKAKELAKNSKR